MLTVLRLCLCLCQHVPTGQGFDMLMLYVTSLALKFLLYSYVVANISEHFPPQPTLVPQHRELHALLFTISVWVLLRPLLTITSKMQETGPTVYSPRRYVICDQNY